MTKAFLAFAIGAAALCQTIQAQVRDWREIPKPPLRKQIIQEPKRIELPNGLVIFLQEDHELPLVRGTAIVRGGSREEPAAKIGLVDIYGEVWRTGGTKTRSGDELDDFLEARAAQVETSSDLDSTGISWDSLKDDFDDVFTVVADLVKNPAFREDKIALARNQMNTVIARRNDDIGGIAEREAAKLAYGASSPYARVAEYATVGAVTRDDLLAWHKRYVHPNNMIIGVHGDFDSKKMEAKIRAAFGNLAKGPAAAKRPEVEIKPAKAGVYFIPKEDVTQSEIRLVHLGVTKDNPDYFAIEVMNELFGGGFSSRLFSNIRTEKGLAYAVGGGIGSSYDHPGMFSLMVGTKSASTGAAIDALRTEIESLQTKPIAGTELSRAKESILNSFIFAYDTKAKVLNQKMRYEFYGYPADFLERYRTAVEKVTPEEISRVAKQYIKPGDIAVLVVGRESDFDRPLSSLGPVTKLDITIPSADAGEAKPAQATNAEGRALINKVVEGLGGKERLATLKAVRTVGSMNMQTPQGAMNLEIDELWVIPDMRRQIITMPMGQMTMVVSPKAAFMTMGPNVRDLPPSQKESAMKDSKEDVISIALHADDPAYSFTAAGKEKVGDVEASILEVSGEGFSTRLFVDPATGRVVRRSSRVMEMGQSGERVADNSDFRTVNGLTMPFKTTIKMNGQDFGSGEIKLIEVNPTVDPKVFEKP